ncbi:MAG: bifunctional [glutamine synthetase] adenylyltransferase/[glutamine synthetase]-adenylyl-L-tyrosine phosphorylase [Rhodospirillaceae bacterium]|nr:bifunctional [glutamine synthetase] adenylyltransferase/[glutamine synthetase]-adenylyl-L-tyrosine phosphorylase [Rhodospirillaceae bacterium]
MFVQSTTALPRPFDPARAAALWAEWTAAEGVDDPGLAAFMRASETQSDLAHLITGVFGNSPYLSGLLLRHPQLVKLAWDRGWEAAWAAIAADLQATGVATPGATTQAELMARLRRIKGQAAQVIGLADIAGAWPLARVTGALTDLADGCVIATVRFLLREATARGEIHLPDPDRPERGCGYMVFALGKHGGRELNYSSDVDLLVLFDDASLPYTGKRSAQEFAVKLTRELVKIMQERTVEGYVFRTDLRLRPDPGSTALAVSRSAASIYYESYGQNWERAAMIKARLIAGDSEAAASFLKDLETFIWRKSLDFYALQDIHSIKRQIYAHKGGGTVTVPGHNVKLGRGGIREIEFFAQTQQLIWGGRKPEARSSQTLRALDVLTDLGVVAPTVRDDLHWAYEYLRRLEHRLQMINDEQTQKLPADAAGLAHIAAFMGYDNAQAFSDALTAVLRTVEGHYATLFEDAPTLGVEGNLVFTGTEDDPDTLETLRKLGFQNPGAVSSAVRVWHTGRAKATKSLRARQILTELMPRLLTAFGRTTEPDAAFLRFDTCMNQINSGVQLLSVFYSNPKLLDFIAELMGDAPQLAEDVARNPALLDFVLDPRFFEPPAPLPDLIGELTKAVGASPHLDVAIDDCKRWTNEHRFQVGAQVLRGLLDPLAAGRAIADIAEAVITVLVPRVQQEFAQTFGHVPDSEIAVLAYGKLGSRELTPTSDLDLVVLYTGPEDAVSADGPRSLPASAYYIRLTQRIVTALTSLSQQGRLFDVDLRLRPAGDKGALACSVEGFAKYQAEDAWTWEHMALTRARVILGSAAARGHIEAAIQSGLGKPRDPDALVVAVADMRARMRQAQGSTGPWNIKRMAGGLIDVEFIVQYLLLAHPGLRAADAPELTAAIARLAGAGHLAAAEAETLRQALGLWTRLQSMLRLLIPGDQAKPPFPAGLAAKLARVAGQGDLAAVEALMARTAGAVSEIFAARIDRPAQKARIKFGDTIPR